MLSSHASLRYPFFFFRFSTLRTTLAGVDLFLAYVLFLLFPELALAKLKLHTLCLKGRKQWEIIACCHSDAPIPTYLLTCVSGGKNNFSIVRSGFRCHCLHCPIAVRSFDCSHYPCEQVGRKRLPFGMANSFMPILHEFDYQCNFSYYNFFGTF